MKKLKLLTLGALVPVTAVSAVAVASCGDKDTKFTDLKQFTSQAVYHPTSKVLADKAIQAMFKKSTTARVVILTSTGCPFCMSLLTGVDPHKAEGAWKSGSTAVKADNHTFKQVILDKLDAGKKYEVVLVEDIAPAFEALPFPGSGRYSANDKGAIFFSRVQNALSSHNYVKIKTEQYPPRPTKENPHPRYGVHSTPQAFVVENGVITKILS